MVRILSLLLILALPACRPSDPGAEALSSCDLGVRACEVQATSGPVRVDVAPRPVPMMRELSFVLRYSGAPSTVVRLDLNGIGMDMGPNQVRMTPVEGGVWRATMYLPVCATGSMRWRLGVTVGDEGGASQRWYFPLSVAGGA